MIGCRSMFAGLASASTGVLGVFAVPNSGERSGEIGRRETCRSSWISGISIVVLPEALIKLIEVRRNSCQTNSLEVELNYKKLYNICV
jgi:hypothetical protein